ncbi:MAG TPA: C4-type zinc ribbon domain-containing protein [Candidatus Manganitrophaceae bacterium]
MKEQLELLIQLQELDLQLNQHKEEQKKLPEKVQIAQKTLDQAKETLSLLKNALDLLNKERKEKEQALQTSEEKITKLKGRLTELKTNKEYQAHLLEIEAANAEKGRIEESLLMSMEKGDSLKKEVAGQETAVGAEEKKFKSEKEQVEETLKKLSESAQALEKKSSSLAEHVEKKLLEEYRRLIAVRKGLAVVSLKGYICTGCHFSLPPQLVAEVKKREKILNCTYCHRILYPSP